MKVEFQKKLGYVILNLGIRDLLRLVPISPFIVEFRVTENCNSHCVMCNAWKNKFINELSTEEAKDALRQLRDIGVNVMIFIGGEPLLRPDIGELVKEASLLKFPIILLVTNGLLLEDKARELLENGITHITVSVDSIGQGHDAIRGIPGIFEKAIRGVKTVQKLKEEMNLNVAVTLITNMLMKQNVDMIPQVVELSRNLGVYWDFNLLDSNLDLFKGISLPEISTEDKKKIDKTIDYLTEVRRESPGLMSSCEHMLKFARKYLKKENLDDFHCVHGYEALHIRSNGEVHPCWILEPIGNLREAKLRDIVGTKKHRELAERIYIKDCPGCTNLCPLNVKSRYLISHRLSCGR